MARVERGCMLPSIDEGHRNRGSRHDVAPWAVSERSLSVIPVAMHEAPASMRSNWGPCSGGARLAKQAERAANRGSYGKCGGRLVGRFGVVPRKRVSDVSYMLP
jgi:hypothetical protein